MDIRKTDVYVKWLDGLRDIRARARVLARAERLAAGNAGDAEPVGEGVSPATNQLWPRLPCVLQTART